MTQITRMMAALRACCLQLAVLVAIVLSSPALWSQNTLTVAAAADLGPALREIAGKYEKHTGMHLALVFGSSGNLTTQIEQGAPYEVFLSADMGYPKRLQGAGLAVPNSLTAYAAGKLVLWIPHSSRLDLRVMQLKSLLSPEVQHIAIANPEHAPYGRAAVAALRQTGLYEQVKSKLVFGENVAQAAQFVTAGSAQIGIIPEALALAPELQRAGRYWELPAGTYPPITQGAVVLKKSQNEKAARDFVNYLKSSEAAAILQRYGFTLPEVVR